MVLSHNIHLLQYNSCFNSLRPEQNGQDFTDIFKCICSMENVYILIQISISYKPLPEPVFIEIFDTLWHHWAVMRYSMYGFREADVPALLHDDVKTFSELRFMPCTCDSYVLHQYIPDSKVHGANMGPIWSQQDPDGPHVGPMNFAIWDVSCTVCCHSNTVNNLSNTIIIP